MIRRFLALWTFSLLMCACGAQPEPVAEQTTPLYVDALGGGHGPFPCQGPIPGFGYIDVFSQPNFAGTCMRFRGDFNGGTQWQGYQVIPSNYVSMNILSARFSPQYTSGVACYWTPQGPNYAPCAGQTPYPVYGSSGHDIASLPTMPGGAYALVLEYYPLCPTSFPANTMHFCGAPYSPEDASGYVTFVLGDGFVSPGLPFGHPLTLPNSYSLAGDCLANTVNYGFPFKAPPGDPYGDNIGVAVYTCP